ncbi:MAG: bifunctional (p)ppGpp synthetase/guanosine-3',5'-bis(diphosphate) 3'-pyrophosphohydrolase [Gammaproteobacteria bacterium]
MPESSSQVADLRAWLERYYDSAGVDGAPYLELFDGLAAGPLGEPATLEEARQLLEILAGLSADPRTLCSALLFVARHHGEDPERWRTQLPGGVREQLQSLLKLQQVQTENVQSEAGRSAEGLRRLLLALVGDVRVVLIALAWQLVRLRAAREQRAEATELARETMLIHAPLANRLGVWQLTWELEDLAFRFLEPENYPRVARQVAERRSDRERFINSFIDDLTRALDEAGLEGEVRGRPKHIYSIWKKMQRKGLDFGDLFDLRAVRVLVKDVPTCYSVLGLVHTRWQPIPGEFDDYITTPKGNDYQSLHTAVIGPAGKAVEVQIRTWEMNEHAELGVAAHWRYKEGGPNDPAFDRKVTAMRQLLDAGEGALDDESLLESFQAATSEDRVYVLTPRGEVIDLAQGATVLDFAYHVHTEVGHRCRGAKVNGRIVPLTQRVQNGDRVEILTGREPRPSRDWLNPRLGFIHGARARAKVRQWFKREGHEESLAQPSDGITIEGVGNLMTNLARCCQPVPGDPVVGYVTRGRGVTIHREDCANVLRWQTNEPHRLLQVHWGRKGDGRYRAGIRIQAFNRRDLFRDLSAVMAAAEVTVTDISSRRMEDSEMADIRLQVQVRNYEQLSELLSRISGVRNVVDARRLREGAPSD